MRLALLLGLLTVTAFSARAQASGACETGTAQQFLSNSVLQASVFNTGGLFFGGTTPSGEGYLIPKQEGKSPLYAASFWLGGVVGSELRVSAALYGTYAFWPGPLEDAAQPPQDCSSHDRIFAVSRADIERYYDTGELADDLRDWPHQLGAPVLDGDGDPSNYDLAAGDQPDLVGDQAVWWVMHDAGTARPTDATAPLGVEVRVHAFVYGSGTGIISPVLTQTSFYRYEVINRSRQTIEPMYATMWSDSDLGDAGDDQMGTDTLRNLVFVYNASDVDDVYGSPPPAQGIQLLQSPVGLANSRDDDFDGSVDEPGERLGATATSTIPNGGPNATADPTAPEGYYRYMRGLWNDGSPYTALGFGYQSAGRTTPYMFTGDPVTESFWSAMNSDGEGASLRGFNRRMLISTGPFRLAPDSSVVLLYAMPFGQGRDHLNSVSVVRQYATALQRLQTDGAFERMPVVERPSQPVGGLSITRLRPNPSRQPEAILTLPVEARVHVEIVDVLGRRLARVADGVLPAGETTLRMPAGLAPGAYRLRVRVVPGAEEVLSFTVVR